MTPWRASDPLHLLRPDPDPEGRAWPMARLDRQGALARGLQDCRTPEGAWRQVGAQ
jgi:hypothetical protein